MAHTCNPISISTTNQAQLRYIEECCIGTPVNASMALEQSKTSNATYNDLYNFDVAYITGDQEYPARTAKMKILRYTGHTISTKIPTQASNEFRADRQVSALVQTKGTTDGAVNFEFSAGEYDGLLEGALYGLWSRYYDSRKNQPTRADVSSINASTRTYSGDSSGRTTPVTPIVVPKSFYKSDKNTATMLDLLDVPLNDNGTYILDLKPGCRVEVSCDNNKALNGYAMVVDISINDLSSGNNGLVSYLTEFYPMDLTANRIAIANTNKANIRLYYIDGGTHDISNLQPVGLYIPSYIRNGTTKHSYAFETEYLSSPNSVISHIGMRVSSMALNIANGSPITGNFNLKGTLTSAGSVLKSTNNATDLHKNCMTSPGTSDSSYRLEFSADTRGRYVTIFNNNPNRRVPDLGIGQTIFFTDYSNNTSNPYNSEISQYNIIEFLYELVQYGLKPYTSNANTGTGSVANSDPDLIANLASFDATRQSYTALYNAYNSGTAGTYKSFITAIQAYVSAPNDTNIANVLNLITASAITANTTVSSLQALAKSKLYRFSKLPVNEKPASNDDGKSYFANLPSAAISEVTRGTAFNTCFTSLASTSTTLPTPFSVDTSVTGASGATFTTATNNVTALNTGASRTYANCKTYLYDTNGSYLTKNNTFIYFKRLTDILKSIESKVVVTRWKIALYVKELVSLATNAGLSITDSTISTAFSTLKTSLYGVNCDSGYRLYALEIVQPDTDKVNGKYYYSLNRDVRHGDKLTPFRTVTIPKDLCKAYGVTTRPNDFISVIDSNYTIPQHGNTITKTYIYSTGSIASDSSEYQYSDTDATTVTPIIPALKNVPLNGSINFGSLSIDNRPMSDYTYIKKIDLQIENQLREVESLGRLYAVDLAAGTVKVTLNFDAYFTDLKVFYKYVNSSYSGISFYVDDPLANDGLGATYFFDIPKIKFSQATTSPSQGNQDVMVQISAEAVMGNPDNDDKGYTIQISVF